MLQTSNSSNLPYSQNYGSIPSALKSTHSEFSVFHENSQGLNPRKRRRPEEDADNYAEKSKRGKLPEQERKPVRKEVRFTEPLYEKTWGGQGWKPTKRRRAEEDFRYHAKQWMHERALRREEEQEPARKVRVTESMHENTWDLQEPRPRKRRRSEEDVEYCMQQLLREKAPEQEQPQEPARKVRVTQSMREQENARYGVLSAAGRRAVRLTEERVRAAASAAYDAVIGVGKMYDDIRRNVAEKEKKRKEEEERARRVLMEDWENKRVARERKEEKQRYQATVESVSEEDGEENSETSEQDTESEDNDGVVKDSTDNESALESDSDDTSPKQFEPSPKPASTVLPSYLVPAGVPPSTVPQSRSGSVSETRPKSPSARSSLTQSQATEGVAPAQPVTASSGPSQPLTTPGPHHSPGQKQSPSDRVIEKILGKAPSPTFLELLRPSTASGQTPRRPLARTTGPLQLTPVSQRASRPSAGSNGLTRPSHTLLRPVAGSTRPSRLLPSVTPASSKPVPTQGVPLQGVKAQTAERVSSQPLSQPRPPPPQPNNLIQCPECTLHNFPTSTFCHACGASACPPRPAPRSYATSTAPHDTLPDDLDGVVLVEYTRKTHSRPRSTDDSAGEEYMCTGAAGPAGTIDEGTGEPVAIPEEELVRLLKAKKRKEREDLKRPGRWEKRMRDVEGKGLGMGKGARWAYFRG